MKAIMRGFAGIMLIMGAWVYSAYSAEAPVIQGDLPHGLRVRPDDHCDYDGRIKWKRILWPIVVKASFSPSAAVNFLTVRDAFIRDVENPYDLLEIYMARYWLSTWKRSYVKWEEFPAQTDRSNFLQNIIDYVNSVRTRQAATNVPDSNVKAKADEISSAVTDLQDTVTIQKADEITGAATDLLRDHLVNVQNKYYLDRAYLALEKTFWNFIECIDHPDFDNREIGFTGFQSDVNTLQKQVAVLKDTIQVFTASFFAEQEAFQAFTNKYAMEVKAAIINEPYEKAE